MIPEILYRMADERYTKPTLALHDAHHGATKCTFGTNRNIPRNPDGTLPAVWLDRMAQRCRGADELLVVEHAGGHPDRAAGQTRQDAVTYRV